MKLRTGRKVGRTLYEQRGPHPSDSDPLIGLMDTPELAQRVVNAVNAVARIRELHTPDHAGPDNTPQCNTCRTGTWPCPTLRALEGQ